MGELPPSSREHPWHLRRATAQHYRWYRNLIDLHRLTSEWLAELHIEKPSHFLGAKVAPDVTSYVTELEKATQDALVGNKPEALDRYLDDSYPEDTLGRLERSVWALQAWTLQSIRERLAADKDRPEILNRLEQASWRAGRDCARSHWPELIASGRVMDTRETFAAFRDCALVPRPGVDPFLVVRAVAGELQLELLECPHRLGVAEIMPVADELCEMHWHWSQGYLQTINSRLAVEYRRGKNGRRCNER